MLKIMLFLVIALFFSLIVLTIFSLTMISISLNKKQHLFASKPKREKIKKSKKTKKPTITTPKYEIPAPDTDTSFDMQEDVIDFSQIPEFSMENDFVQPENKVTKFLNRLKGRVTQAQNDAQARAIQREEIRIQEVLELEDIGETLEEIPEDFVGKLRYWWRNHFGFRVGVCIISILLAFIVIVHSFQTRNRVHLDNTNNVVADTENEETETRQQEQVFDEAMTAFRQTLDDELSPIDVKADSLEPMPNMAEIVATVQQNTGQTTATYPGSHTTKQPSGSIATISIPSINLKNAPVMGSVELSDLAKGTGHFENTPVFDGNVGIAGHNNTHFKYLANLEIGNQIEYTVNGVTRTYRVTDMRAISDRDWGVFTDHGDNRLTLITCEHAVPDRRIAVTAIQVGTDHGTATPQKPTTTNNKKNNSQQHQDSGDYHDAGAGYTDYIGTFTGMN